MEEPAATLAPTERPAPDAMRRTLSERQRSSLFYAFAAVAAGLVTWRYFAVMDWAWPVVIDDAYISFRYAQNLVEGHGLTWNPGEPPVEGYSNLSWTLLLTLPHVLGGDALWFAKIAGLACSLLGLVAMFSLVRTVTGCRWTATLAAAGLGHSHDYIMNAAMGLETAWYLLWLLVALERLARLQQAPTARTALTAGGLLALVALSRAEAPLVVLALLGLVAALTWRRPQRALVWRAAAVTATIVTPVMLGRLLYYGDLTANPVHAKDIDSTMVTAFLELYPLNGGPAYVLDALRMYLPLLGAAAVALLRAAPAAGRQLLMLLLVAALYAVGIWGTWPVMGYGHRLVLPMIAALIALAAPGLVAIVRHTRSAFGALLVAGLVLLTGRSMAEPRFASEIQTLTGPNATLLGMYVRTMNELHEPLASALARVPPMTMALTDCGLIPYRSRHRTIDLFGLNDRHIARHGPDVDYLLGRNPELVILMSTQRDRFGGSFIWELPYWESDAFHAAYERHSTWEGLLYKFILFRRRDWTPPAGL